MRMLAAKNQFRIITIAALLFFALHAHAEIKQLNDILSKATAEETQNLPKLLQQIQLSPTKDPKTGQSVMKVVKVEKGSLFDREGVKVGDLLSTGQLKKKEQ